MMERDLPDRRFFADDEIEGLLADAKVVQAYLVSVRGRYWTFVLCLLACVVAGVAEQCWLFAHAGEQDYKDLPSGTQVATALLTLVAAFYAFYQWADARREASLEKFYERLKLTNDRYGDWPHARGLVEHFWAKVDAGARTGPPDADFQRRMYVFLELDNLEYMVVRWQRGFARPLLMGRAMRTFSSRCVSPAFRKLALRLVEDSGYMVETGRLANKLAERGELAELERRLGGG